MPAGHAVAFKAWQRSTPASPPSLLLPPASPLPVLLLLLVLVGVGAVANAKKFHRNRATSLFTLASAVCGSAVSGGALAANATNEVRPSKASKADRQNKSMHSCLQHRPGSR